MEELGKLKAEQVEFEGRKYWVSTINRESSSMYGGIYAETFVFDEGKNVVAQDEHCRGSLFAHDRMVKALRETGKPYDGNQSCEFN